MKIKISRAKEKDLKPMAKIAAENFSGLSQGNDAIKWIRCNFGAFPRMQYFIAKKDEEIMGYILWLEHGGFRKEAVWELEQIAIKKTFQGQGIGTKLIDKSFSHIKTHLEKRKSLLKAIKVTTGTQNQAQNLYKKILGVEAEAVIKDLFRGDEVIMIARFKYF